MYSRISFNLIKPDGWILRFLNKQVSGITGNIEKSGKPFDDKTTDWFVKDTEQNDKSWVPFEQKAYWIDGALKCAYLTNNKKLLNKVQEQIYGVLKNADKDGYIGPENLRTNEGKSKNFFNRWPHVVLFRAMIAEYEASGDERILEALLKHYLNDEFEYYDQRNITNIEIMVWLYNKTKNEQLIKKAEYNFKVFCETCKWQGMRPENLHDLSKSEFVHGVTYCEVGKLGILLYNATQNEEYKKLSVDAFEKIFIYSMLACSVPSSSEFILGNTATDSHEICDITDFTWAMYYMFQNTGDVKYLDAVEGAIFNALGGSVNDDFTKLQYFSCPNQIVCSMTSNHNAYMRGDSSMMYKANGLAQCCVGNVNRALPNYVYNMYVKSETGYAAVLYGDCVFEDKNIKITQKTNYPFDKNIKFEFCVKNEKKNSFELRIPFWCESASIYYNGICVVNDAKGGNMCTITDALADNDIIELCMNYAVRIEKCDKNIGAVCYGPVVYCLDVDEKENQQGELFSLSKWNIAIINDLKNIKVVKQENNEFSFNKKNPPIYLIVPAKEVIGWDSDKKSKIERQVYAQRHDFIDDEFNMETIEGDFEFTPVVPNDISAYKLGEKEVLKFVPYGTTRLRMTNLPLCDN